MHDRSRPGQTKLVQLWTASFRELAPYYNVTPAVMDENERRRESALRFAVDRWRFRLGRFFLRSVLSSLVDVPSNRLRFGQTASGKPFLILPHRHCTPSFSFSHCRELVCVVASHGCELGVDVETIRPVPDISLIARRTFTDGEMRVVESAARPEIEFFRIWTCREAVGKAMGTGLLEPHLGSGVGFADERTISWCGIDENGHGRQFRVLNIGDDSHAAALAVETEGPVRVKSACFKSAVLLDYPGWSSRRLSQFRV